MDSVFMDDYSDPANVLNDFRQDGKTEDKPGAGKDKPEISRSEGGKKG